MTDADHAIAQALDAHEAAYHPGIACPETQEGRCALARPVESPEDRMRDATTPARPAMTFREARDAGLLPPAVALALPQDSDARTDTTDRTFATYLDRTERDQLDARAATAEQERDEALDDRDAYKEARDVLRKQLDRLREQLTDMTDQRNERLTLAESSRLAKRLDQAEEARDGLRQQRDRTLADLTDAGNEVDQLTVDNARLRAELGAAQELIAVLDDVTEQLDRARAAYATTPGEGSVTITLDNSAGTFTPRHPGDALADALRNAYTTGQLGLLHERVVDLLDDDTPREDPMGRLVDALFAARHKPTPPALGSLPPRAQDGIRPAAWEQQAIDAAHTALADAWTHLAEDDVYTEQVAITAVRAIIDAGLAGDGGRCRKCGSGFPRTLPAGQDPLCWTCSSEEQTGLDEYTPDRAQVSESRRLLDHAIDAALPLAGGRVEPLLRALRGELARVDAERARRAEREG